MAAHLGTTGSNLHLLRRRHNLPREKKGGRPSTFRDMTAARLLAMRGELGSWHKVALRLGHKTGTVAGLRRRLGIAV